MKPLFAALAALIAITATPTAAQVYKCKEGGTTVFSAQPCGAGSQAIDVRPALAPSPPSYMGYSSPSGYGRPSQGNVSVRGETKVVWVCQDGTVSDKTCPGKPKKLDDLSATELNAYAKEKIAAEKRAEAIRKEEEAKRQAEEAKLQAKRDAEETLLKNLCGRYLGGDAVIGMTEEQFNKCSWEGGGSPTKNFTETAYGKSVQYVYKGASRYRFYYFRNGVLTAKQN